MRQEETKTVKVRENKHWGGKRNRKTKKEMVKSD